MENKIKELKLKVNNLMTKDHCNYFIEFFENYSIKSREETSYKHIEKKELKDNFKSICLNELAFNDEKFLQPLELAYSYIRKMMFNYEKHLQKNICPTYDLKNINFTKNIRILRYEKGQYIKDHSDVCDNIRASCTINLNEDYEGGELRFFNGKIKEKFKTGDSIIFPAEPIWIHGTEPIKKGVRYCINCFLGDIK